MSENTPTPDSAPRTLDQALHELETIEGDQVWEVHGQLAVGAMDRVASQVIRHAIRELGPDGTVGQVEDVLLNALCWMRLFSLGRLAQHWTAEDAKSQEEEHGKQ